MRKREAICSVVLAGFVVLAGGPAQAAPGALDPGFGSGGKVTTSIGAAGVADAWAVLLQPDGKIVAVGDSFNTVDYDFGLARYNADGSLDPSFGAAGKVTTPIGQSGDIAFAGALQPDGKIVVAGKTDGGGSSDFGIARYNANGGLDTAFGDAGKVRLAISSGFDAAKGLALQVDGKVVVAGRGSVNGVDEDFTLVRLRVDGSLDTGFGLNGVVSTPIGSSHDIASAVALQPDGKIVVAGTSHIGNRAQFALARYNADGSLDSSFGAGGKVTTPVGGNSDSANALVLQPDGKLVVAGTSFNGANTDFALARFAAAGTLDPSFGVGGKVTTAIGSAGFDFARAVVLQPDGKIVATGSSNVPANGDFALVRYNADGSLDPGFGAGGKLTTAMEADEGAFGSALQPDGKIVAAGFRCSGNTCDFALARYLGSTLTVARAGTGTGTITSSPAGIDCSSTCSAPLAALPVTLTATPSAGSRFAGWSGDCSGTAACTLAMSADHSATATFDVVVKCVAPKLRGKRLTRAKRTMRAAHCSVGKVTRAFSRKVKKGKVISQQPKPGVTRPAGSKVKLKISKGKRRKGRR
jgi:uncharacterized delta-60 repeat protein